MSCVGKYQRNLMSLQTTKLFFFLSEVLHILQIGFVATLPQIERYFSSQSIFWIYNSGYQFFYVGELISHILVIIPVFQILSTTSIAPKEANIFMTKLPKELEPRRDHVGSIAMQKSPKHNIIVVKPWKGKGFGKGNSNISLGKDKSNIFLPSVE